jgi:hypothetical protein
VKGRAEVVGRREKEEAEKRLAMEKVEADVKRQQDREDRQRRYRELQLRKQNRRALTLSTESAVG